MLASKAVLGYLIAVPLVGTFVSGVGWHDLSRMAQIALASTCAVALTHQALIAGRSDFWSTRQRKAFALSMIALAFGSVLAASDPAMAAREAALLFGCVCIGATIFGVVDRRELVAATVLASALYVAVLLLIVVIALVVGQTLVRSELPIGYDNYRFYNHVQTVALPLTGLAIGLTERGTWLRRIAWLATVGGFALLIATAGRGTAVGLVVAALAAWGVFGRVALPLLRTFALGVAGGTVLYVALFVALPALTGTPADDAGQYHGAREGSIHARFFLWGLALDYIRESPWLGIGPMHYANRPNIEAAHPHNFYLQVAAEWGLPMLVLLLGVAAYGFRRIVGAVRGCSDERTRTEGVGLFMACVAIAVDAAFSGNFVMPVSQVWIAFAIGWTLAWYRVATPRIAVDSTSPRGRLGVRALAAAAVASQLWLVWNVWPEMTNLEAHLSEVNTKVANPRTNPRFWSHGWF